jgi:hypothetical protein
MTNLGYAIGFFVYGALCYVFIGAAAIVWHDRISLALLLLGGLFTVVAYMVPAMETDETRRFPAWLVAVSVAGWALPIFAAIKVILWVS